MMPFTTSRITPEECRRLTDLIEEASPGARTILDVACGTGEHGRFLKQKYEIDGLDLNENHLRAARTKNPAGNYICADMMNFELARTYDVVTRLFSAIGIVRTYERLERAIACMARHVKRGGILIVEPWFTPEQWHPGKTFVLAGIGHEKVYRVGSSIKHRQHSILRFHYLRSTPNGIEHHWERIELGLFTRDEMAWTFEFAGMHVLYDLEGLMGRGLYVGKHSKSDPSSRFIPTLDEVSKWHRDAIVSDI